jgi:hypothetical protein
MLPNHDPQDRRVVRRPKTQTFAKLLIDLEELPHSREVVLGELRERELRGES